MFQNYLVLIPAKKHIKCFNGATQIYSWKSNVVSEKVTENITNSYSLFALTFVNHCIVYYQV